MKEITQRKALLNQIEQNRKSKALLYVMGDRQGMGAHIGSDAIDLFVEHLDKIGPTEKISLILYTSGGNVSAAWNLVNLLLMFCDDFEVIVPGKCRSAGTLVSLGANRVVMTKQATLGPIDPSIQHPLGPSFPEADPMARAEVSVEAVEGYLDAIRQCKAGEQFEGQALVSLSQQVHPLVLGEIFRSRQQIRDLAKRLLQRHKKDEPEKIKKIIDFLCSESGSHDYTINRREAKKLGLNIEKCSEKLYAMLQKLSNNYSSQLELREPYNPNTVVADASLGTYVPYHATLALIESVNYGAHHFIRDGQVRAIEVVQQDPQGIQISQPVTQDQHIFNGWRKM